MVFCVCCARAVHGYVVLLLPFLCVCVLFHCIYWIIPCLRPPTSHSSLQLHSTRKPIQFLHFARAIDHKPILAGVIFAHGFELDQLCSPVFNSQLRSIWPRCTECLSKPTTTINNHKINRNAKSNEHERRSSNNNNNKKLLHATKLLGK